MRAHDEILCACVAQVPSAVRASCGQIKLSAIGWNSISDTRTPSSSWLLAIGGSPCLKNGASALNCRLGIPGLSYQDAPRILGNATSSGANLWYEPEARFANEQARCQVDPRPTSGLPGRRACVAAMHGMTKPDCGSGRAVLRRCRTILRMHARFRPPAGTA